MTRQFNVEEVFGEDFLYFSEARNDPEENNAEVALLREMLSLKLGSRLLDVPCGYGRLARLFAEQGVHVTGLDVSPLLLNRARVDAVPGVKLDYKLADMAELEVRDFDAILCWWSSFGYHDDETEKDVLNRFRRALRPGGKMLLEVGSLSWYSNLFFHNPNGHTTVTRVGPDMMIEERRPSSDGSRLEASRTVIRDGLVRLSSYSCRLFTPSELRDWILRAGFSNVTMHRYNGQPFAWDSKSLVAIATA